MGTKKGSKRGSYKFNNREDKKIKKIFGSSYTQKEFEEITEIIQELKTKGFKTRDILLMSIRNFYKIN